MNLTPYRPGRRPRRLTITLNAHIHEALRSRSRQEGRSVSNLCAYLLEVSVSRPSPPPGLARDEGEVEIA